MSRGIVELGASPGSSSLKNVIGAKLNLVRLSVAVLPKPASSNFLFTNLTVSLLKPTPDMTILDGIDSHGLWEEKNVGTLDHQGCRNLQVG